MYSDSHFRYNHLPPAGKLKMKPNTDRNVLIFLLAFLGLGAMYGGFVLIISPSGSIFGMPLTMLANSPFSNFLIPGIILFSILGIAPAGLIFCLVKRPAGKFAELFNCFADMYWGWTYCIYIGFALITWIQVEMMVLGAVHWSHTLYMFVAMAIILLHYCRV